MPTRYTTVEYVGLLQTDSLVNTLDPDPRGRFLADIASLIDDSFRGVVERNYLYELIVAERGQRLSFDVHSASVSVNSFGSCPCIE